MLLCENLSDHSDAALLLRIHAAFEQPFGLSGVQLTMSASASIAVTDPDDGSIGEHLQVVADTAM